MLCVWCRGAFMGKMCAEEKREVRCLRIPRSLHKVLRTALLPRSKTN